jgi:adenylate cyclase
VSLASALVGVDTRVLAVGFGDLVGSTELGTTRSLTELNAALDVFERTATDVIAATGGRVVKFIGDEVMFRAESADVACSSAIALVDAVRGDPRLPALRAGVAHGIVASREGDFYGPVVNLAARLTKLAPADGLIASRQTVDVLVAPGDFAIRHLGDIEVRGFAETVGIAEMSARSL